MITKTIEKNLLILNKNLDYGVNDLTLNTKGRLIANSDRSFIICWINRIKNYLDRTFYKGIEASKVHDCILEVLIECKSISSFNYENLKKIDIVLLVYFLSGDQDLMKDERLNKVILELNAKFSSLEFNY
jgi:hypothetical protein